MAIHYGGRGPGHIARSIGGFSPLSLFAASEPGFWYDPSDLTTLFQDSAGTTPVTAAGQSVGLVLDKRLGLVQGPEILTNGDFSAGITGWTNASTGTGSVSISGGAASLTGVDASNRGRLTQFIAVEVGKTYQLLWTIVSGTANSQVRVENVSAVFDKFGPSASGKYQAVFVPSTSSVTININVYGSGTVVFDNISVKELPGNHAIQSTALSRPTYQVDGNGRSYLSFDGSDDFLVTPTITPGADKAQLFAGVRKLGDTGYQCIAELSLTAATTAGTMALGASSLTGDPSRRTWSSVLSGSVVGNTGGVGVYAAPTTAVLAGLFDIAQTTAAAEQILRVNGAAVTQTYGAADAGTGSFAANPVYIGRRGGNANPLNGQIYSLIGRFGANLPDAQISRAEAWINARTGAY